MLNKRVQPGIDVFFSQLYHIPQEIRQATSSSFTRCRAKISFTAFKEVMQQLVQFFYSNYHFKKYYGYRLIAIDGSVFTLPRAKEMIAEFGENVLSNSGKWIKARVSFASDVLNNIRAGAITGPCKQAERDQALELIAQLLKNNIKT